MAQTTTTADVPDAEKLQELVAEVDTGGRQLTGAVALPTDDETAEAAEPARLEAAEAPAATEAPGEKVVSLDAFRKK